MSKIKKGQTIKVYPLFVPLPPDAHFVRSGIQKKSQRNADFFLLPLLTKTAVYLVLIIMKPAFDNLDLIINDPIDQSVFVIYPSGPKTCIIKF